MLQQSRWWAVAALAATFVAGGLLGWAVGSRSGPRGHGFGLGPAGPARIMGFLTRELDLTPAQRDSVQAILTRHRPDLEDLWREVHPRFDSVRTAIGAEIRAQLTPAQEERFRELERRLDQGPRFGRGAWQRKPAERR